MTDEKGGMSPRFQTEMAGRLMEPGRSSLLKYRELVVGDSGMVSLLRFELLTSLLGSLPGAAGLLGRRVLYRGLFAEVGKGVTLGRNITLRHPHKIRLGSQVTVDELAVLDAKGGHNQGIRVGDRVFVSRGAILSCKEGDISIGENTNIGTRCLIHSESSVSIGKNVLIAAYCYIVAGGLHDFSRIDLAPMHQPSLSRGGIIIGDNVWLGAGVIVLDGVRIGRDAVIGAGAVVTKDIPEFAVAVGIPAAVVRSRKEEA